jgi:hypothetical protein
MSKLPGSLEASAVITVPHAVAAQGDAAFLGSGGVAATNESFRAGDRGANDGGVEGAMVATREGAGVLAAGARVAGCGSGTLTGESIDTGSRAPG